MTERTFLRSLNNQPPPAFILGSGTAHALGFVRSLGRRGIPVVAVSAGAGPRLRSRYCWIDRVFDSEATLLEFLTRVGAQMPTKGVLIPTGDGEVLFLLKHRARLNLHFQFVLSETDVLERLANKRFQYQYAESVGVPIPRTYCPDGDEDIQHVARSVSYPCIVKPAHSHLWQRYRRRVSMHRWLKAAHVDTPEQLLACYGQMREGGVELVVQERIEGAECRLYAAYLYLDHASAPIASFVMQKQRQWPPEYGNGSYSIGCRRDDVVDLSVKLLKPLGYRGIANVEFKEDPKDGQLKLIEVNVRAGNRIALAIDSGVDLPYIAYRASLGEPPVPLDTYEVGVAWIDLLRDAAGLSYYRKAEGLSLRAWASSAWKAKSHPYFAVDDPLPFLAHTYRIARDALS